MLGIVFARQRVYKEDVVKKTKELFGETSVEYGMALCGSLQLEPQLKRYGEHFTAEERQEPGEAKEWIEEVDMLREKIVTHIGPSPQPAPWFAPKA